MTNDHDPADPVEDDATPVPVPPYENAPSSTGLVIEDDASGPADDDQGQQ